MEEKRRVALLKTCDHERNDFGRLKAWRSAFIDDDTLKSAGVWKHAGLE